MPWVDPEVARERRRAYFRESYRSNAARGNDRRNGTAGLVNVSCSTSEKTGAWWWAEGVPRPTLASGRPAESGSGRKRRTEFRGHVRLIWEGEVAVELVEEREAGKQRDHPIARS
jgi:hypothetical protein